jgi:hypothetical protein
LKKFKISDHKFHGRHVHQDSLSKDLTRPDPQQAFSHHRSYQASQPLLPAQLEKAARLVISHAAQLTEVEGIIPGHLKLLIKAGDSGLVLSMTRPDKLDITSYGHWFDLSFIENYAVTINFILLIPAAFPEDEYLESLTPEKVKDL